MKGKEEYMKMALRLAKKGNGYVNPNPLVGAVIVKGGRVVGSGYHSRFGAPHAEVEALKEAGEEARGGEVYVTLEPCTHHGKTPPCVDALIEKGLDRAFVATLDPNPAVNGKGVEKLRQAGLEVEVGLLREEARQLNEIFFHYTKRGLPFVLLKLALSLDGKIATSTGDARWISSPQSRKEVHRLRARFSAVAVGANTVMSDDPRLTTRKVDGPDGTRLILDGKGRVEEGARIFSLQSEAKTILVTATEIDSKKKEKIEKGGNEVWQEGDRGEIDLRSLLERLAERDKDSLLLEGGGELAWSFLNEGLVNKVLFFIAPKILGGRRAVPAVGGEGVPFVDEAIELEKVEAQRRGKDLVYSAYPKK